MYSRRVHTALGRSRSSGNEVSRITDGVIASMRQLHVSAINQDDNTPPSRTERSQIAAAEITSVNSSQPSRGIDARSMAAQPPKLTITRVNTSVGRASYGGLGGNRGSGVFNGGSGGMSAFRGRPSGMMGRGSTGSFRSAGRGVGRGGRGRGRGRGRGGRGGRRGNRDGGSDKSKADDYDVEIYSPEEWKFQSAREFGVSTPAIVGRTTTIESLREFAPSWPISTTSMRNMVKDSMDAISGGKLDLADALRERVEKNQYVSFRNKDEKREVLKGLYNPNRKIKTVEYAGGNNKIMKELVAGEYEAIKPSPSDDTLGVIQTYTQKNSKYLPKDASKIISKVRTLLPNERIPTRGQDARPRAS